MKLTVPFLLLTVTIAVIAQPDTLVRISFPSAAISTLGPIKPMVAMTSGFTPYSTGLTKGDNGLRSEPPLIDVMQGSAFSKPASVENVLNLADFPASTAVKLNMYRGTILVGQCTGHLVAPRLVLSAAHCILNLNTRLAECDRIIVYSAVDQPFRGNALGSVAEAAVLFRSYLRKENNTDIMLLMLEDPIGDHTGWVGIGFNDDDAFFKDRIFHKFSFPTSTDSQTGQLLASTSLYYNYGLIDVLSTKSLGIDHSPEAVAVPGQSGSAFITADRDARYIVGVSIFANAYQHLRITGSIFQAFAPLIRQGIEEANTIAYTLYPNPVIQTSMLKVMSPLRDYSLIVYDQTGRTVRRLHGGETNVILIERESLLPGVYQFYLGNSEGQHARGAFRVE